LRLWAGFFRTRAGIQIISSNFLQLPNSSCESFPSSTKIGRPVGLFCIAVSFRLRFRHAPQFAELFHRCPCRKFCRLYFKTTKPVGGYIRRPFVRAIGTFTLPRRSLDRRSPKRSVVPCLELHRCPAIFAFLRGLSTIGPVGAKIGLGDRTVSIRVGALPRSSLENRTSWARFPFSTTVMPNISVSAL